MFDSNPNTFWHSQQNMEKDLKIIGVEFKVSSLEFLSLEKSLFFSIKMVLQSTRTIEVIPFWDKFI